ncbi:ABC transporter permease [Anaeromicrobium sediminis]|uniref:ABC transporter n=1 Tax=Anaeromicrobium sediminis TaxID=1478221 RepID=A0A267MEE9_9FIRM|nr:ABC transporter permease [Anaeromicrobium sediminis]PAB57255.1 ABC transporter [Anaeromicrobium sediminis]
MNSLDLFKMAFNNLWRKKTRTFLTVLGVVIGTTSIVVMVSLGIAIDTEFKKSMGQMGDLTVIEVNADGYRPMNEVNSRDKKDVKLDDTAIATFKKIDGVEAVTPEKRMYMRIGVGKYIADMSVVGIDPSVMKEFGFKAEEGRLLASGDKKVLVFGKDTLNYFRNPRVRNEEEPPTVDVLGNKLTLTSDRYFGERNAKPPSDYKAPKHYMAKGVGVLEEGGRNGYRAYMSIEELLKIEEEDEKIRKDSSNRRRNKDENKYETIKVKVKDVESVEGVAEIIKNMGYETFSLTDMVNNMKETTQKIGLILGGIGGISLLVAAIGITNTMIMSIYERTREIGVMKVIGAKLSDIKKLFLIEAGMIGLTGGLAGLTFSYLVSFILNKVAGGMMGGGSDTKISVISIELALGALVFSFIIGVVAGYLPARRAMNLSALKAIKNE